MSDPEHLSPPELKRYLLPFLLSALALLCIAVLRPFVVPVIWAALLAYTSWPLYRHVRRICGGRAALSALAMTTVVALVLIVPLVTIAVLLQREVGLLYQAVVAYRADDTAPSAALRSIPWLGDWVTQALERFAGDPLTIRQLVVDWAQNSRAELLSAVGTVGRNAAKLFIAILTLFFFYRDGPNLVLQTAQVVEQFFSDRLDRYFRAAGAMVRAVVFGMLVTALAQGTVAGIGYAVVGAEAPVLLAALTALASIVPVVGTGLVWGAVAGILLITGHLWPGVALLAWGTLLVHPIDNLIRPLLISNATHVPFLLVMFGVLGGLAAFGLVGLFIGPVALAVATAVWREWLEQRASGPARDRPAPPPADGAQRSGE